MLVVVLGRRWGGIPGRGGKSPPGVLSKRYSRAVVRGRTKIPGGEHHEGGKAEGKPGGTRTRHVHCGRCFVTGTLLIRFPFYSGRWGKTSGETLSLLWFSILMSSNPLETSSPQSSPEALDSKP